MKTTSNFHAWSKSVSSHQNEQGEALIQKLEKYARFILSLFICIWAFVTVFRFEAYLYHTRPWEMALQVIFIIAWAFWPERWKK